MVQRWRKHSRGLGGGQRADESIESSSLGQTRLSAADETSFAEDPGKAPNPRRPSC